MKLLIIRHADPDYSIDSLTPDGWQEARLLADRLGQLDVKACYVSPLGRARDTASVTLDQLGMQAETCEWLREFFPRIQRPDRDEPMIPWDWLPADWTATPEYLDPFAWCFTPVMRAGQVKEEYQRVTSGLDELLARHGYRRDGRLYRAAAANRDTILLFCHFGVECVLLSHLLNISPMPLWHGTCAAPSSVTTLVTEERRKGTAYFRMGTFGDTSHLYAAGHTPSFAARFCETYDNAKERHD